MFKMTSLKNLKKVFSLFIIIFIFFYPLSLEAFEINQETQEVENDSYDPFIDYSEFNQSRDEEEDLNFFLHGRFLTLGFILGPRVFTQTLGEISTPNISFGALLTYFFNLNFALQISFVTGSNSFSFFSLENTGIQGSFALTGFGLDLKYYFDPQNFIREIAYFNPYLIFGYAQVKRTMRVSGVQAFSKQDADQINLGAGIEIPIISKKMFLGIQLSYHFVNFQDENIEVIVKKTERTGIYFKGDLFSLFLILGVNF